MIEPDRPEQAFPIACNLSAADLAARGSEVGNLFAEVEQVRELDDGYAFQFAGSDATATRLLTFTLEERRCCPFFTFELTFEPDHSHIWLRLRGSADIKEFVASSWSQSIAAHS